MDTPRLALRFRDVTPRVDTIESHRKVIDDEGAVWWGWWRKDFEPDQAALFNDLSTEGPGSILIVDRSTKRAFRANYLKVTQDLKQVDSRRIPEYYQENRGAVSGWFLLKDITDEVFDENLGRRIGESTLLILHGEVPPANSSTPRTRRKSAGAGNRILHLSDLHFGSDYAFLSPGEPPSLGGTKQTLTQCLLRDLQRFGVEGEIGLVVITGDFTTRGDWSDETRTQILSELGKLMESLGLTSESMMAIPGNHDVVRYPDGSNIDPAKLAVRQQTTLQHERPFRTFMEELTGRSWRDPLNYEIHFSLGGTDVVICALNSCTIAATKWTEYGYVGTGGLDVLTATASVDSSSRPALKIMALHHHLLPVTQVEAPDFKGVSLTLDAVDLLDAACRAGVQIVLHGHNHQARIQSYGVLPLMESEATGQLVIISGGSTGAHSGRLPGAERNTYSLLSVAADGGVRLMMRELRPDAKPGATLFDQPLPIAKSS